MFRGMDLASRSLHGKTGSRCITRFHIQRGDDVQLSLFEDIDIRQKGVECVVKRIMKSYSMRGYIRDAVKDNDRNELIKLFKESISNYGTSHVVGYSWCSGELKDRESGETYKITAIELADTALMISNKTK